MDKIIIPMDKEELKKYKIEIDTDFWYWLHPFVHDNKLEMLQSIKGYTCKTNNSPIKKYLAVRWVLQNKQAVLIDGVLLDMFTANVIYQVVQYLMKEKKKDLFFKIFNCKIETIARHCLKCF